MNAAIRNYSSFVIFCSTRIPPTGSMKNTYLFCACFLNLLAILYAVEPAKSGCLEKEKALALLETAENFLSKARDAYPSCKKKINTTDGADCDHEKSLAYIEISKKLISGVRENFPSCNKSVIDDDRDETKVERLRDCSEMLATGRTMSGVYTIWPSNFPAEKPLKVYCDLDTDGGGWTVIQRRGKFAVQQDFYQDWESYKNGFGTLHQEFWLGNENIRVLCHEGCKIRFDLVDKDGVKRFAVYDKFNLTGDRYTIDIGGYSGNATDAMRKHNGYLFSTKDWDSSGKAKEYQSGWWHGKEYYCNLNGIYEPGETGSKYVYWWKEPNDYYNLLSVEMKVKPN